MEFDNILYFLLNQTAEETQEIGEEYANDLIRSGCFDKHTLSLYCGENCSRMWIDEDLKQFETIDFYDEAADVLVEKFYITRTVALAYPFSSWSSQPQIGVSCIAGGFFTN